MWADGPLKSSTDVSVGLQTNLLIIGQLVAFSLPVWINLLTVSLGLF